MLPWLGQGWGLLIPLRFWLMSLCQKCHQLGLHAGSLCCTEHVGTSDLKPHLLQHHPLLTRG